MIYKLRDLIPRADTGTQLIEGPLKGRWVRAMHEPFYGGMRDRLRDAWAVLKGAQCGVVAVEWPKPGEFEAAVAASVAPSTAYMPDHRNRGLADTGVMSRRTVV